MNTTTPIKADLNTVELELKFKDMYRTVARNPHGDFYFEMGRAMAERLGVCPPCSKTHGLTEENMVQNSNWMGGRGGGHAGGEAAADHGTLIAPARTAQGRAS